ncbi:hypothetical protein Tco_0290835 [Tanacetum coccineum]
MGKTKQRQQKRRNLRKGQAARNPNGTTMAEGSQIKDYTNLFPKDSDLIPIPMGGGWDGGSHDYRSLNGETFCPPFHPEVRNQMVPATTPLVGFSKEIVWPLGQISLLVKIGDEEHSASARINFMVIRSPSPYIRIIGRPRVRRIQAVPSTAHRMLKFPVTGGTLTLRNSKIIPLECTMVSGPGVPQP